MSYGGVSDAPAATPKHGEFYKHSAQGTESQRSSQASNFNDFSGNAPEVNNRAKADNSNFFEDKVLFWSSVVVTVIFTLVLVPIGASCAYQLYNRDTSNFYDFDDSVDSLIRQSDKIAQQYAGATMNLAPVFINVHVNNPMYSIDVLPLSDLMFNFAQTLHNQVGQSSPYVWGAACSDVASHFSPMTAYPEKYISSDHSSALFRLAWRHDKVNQNEEDSLNQFIRDSLAYADGNFSFSLTGPGLMQTNDTPSIVIGLFVPFFIVAFFFAVMGRTNGFALIVPVIYISCTTVIAAGSLLIIDHKLPVTSFSIVICIGTSLAITGFATVTLMQRMAQNYLYDESHQRSIARRTYLAYADTKETMFLPFFMGIFIFAISSINDEASRSITLCMGLTCMVIFMCNYTLLPASAVFTYPLVFPPSPRWANFTRWLPRNLRRPSAEELQSAQLLSAAAGHENDGRVDDSVLLVITDKARKYSLYVVLGTIILYVIYIIVLFSTSMKVRYNYDSVVRNEDSFVDSLQVISNTYGTGAMEPWFIIYQLDVTTQFLSESDFFRISGIVNAVLASSVLQIPSVMNMMAPTILDGNQLTWASFQALMDNQNFSPDSLRFKAVFRSTVTYDSKYAVIKLYPPSMTDNFINTYAEYMMHVEHFTTNVQNFYNDQGRFYGAFGPSAGMWDAMNMVNNDFKIVMGASLGFIALIYAIVTRAVGATIHGVVAVAFNLMRAFFFGAIVTGFAGFYYAVTPITFIVAAIYFLHSDIVNIMEMLRIRERNRYTEARCCAELINRTEHLRWGMAIVFCPYFLMIFNLTEILGTFGLTVSMIAIGDLFLYRLIFIPAFNALISERFGKLKGYWWPRRVNEPRVGNDELQA